MKAWQVFLVLDVVVLAAAGAIYLTVHGGAVRTVRTGVVLVDANLGHGARTEGTGIVITRGGEVLTNNHVIEGALSVQVTVPETGRTYGARILGYDVGVDAALLQLDGAHGLRTASMAATPASVGQEVLAVGGATGKVQFASGTITGLNRSVTAADETVASESLHGLIEFDASVQPGDSGGPLLDLHGNVVGIDTAGGTRANFYDLTQRDHDSFAIPVGVALSVAGAIEQGRSSATLHVGPTAYLGVELDPVGPGAVVASTLTGSPAARVRLGAGAQITAADGKPITASQQLVKLLLAKRPGDRLALGWDDTFGTHTATVELVSGPAL